jgi:hypothetical protein
MCNPCGWRIRFGAPGVRFMVKPERARASMAATLERIERVVTEDTRA